MRRITTITLAWVCAAVALHAQYEANAFRFSMQKPFGTARFAAQGGAIGALGGDFSAISVNPAGVAVYRASEFSISPSFYWVNTASEYNGLSSKDSKFRFNVGSLGFVSTAQRRTGRVGFSYGIGYSTLANFSNRTTTRSEAMNSSLLDDFTPGIASDPMDLDPFYEQVAWDAGLIGQDGTGSYTNDFKNGGYRQKMDRVTEQSGYLGEYSMTGALNINDLIYIGATAAIHSVSFYEDIYHTESDPAQRIDTLSSFRFTESSTTRGWGYTFRFGMILRPVKILRLGASFQTPVWYQLSEEKLTDMESYFDEESGLQDSYGYSPIGTWDYRLNSPLRVRAQASVILFKMATFSVDYEYADYSMAHLHAIDEAFIQENAWIDRELHAAHNLRAGAEVRLLKMLYFRGGVQYLMSPFNDTRNHSDEWIYSGGMGIRTRKVFFDASYSFGKLDEAISMYYNASGDPEIATNSASGSNLMFTVGLRF